MYITRNCLYQNIVEISQKNKFFLADLTKLKLPLRYVNVSLCTAAQQPIPVEAHRCRNLPTTAYTMDAGVMSEKCCFLTLCFSDTYPVVPYGFLLRISIHHVLTVYGYRQEKPIRYNGVPPVTLCPIHISTTEYSSAHTIQGTIQGTDYNWHKSRDAHPSIQEQSCQIRPKACLVQLPIPNSDPRGPSENSQNSMTPVFFYHYISTISSRQVISKIQRWNTVIMTEAPVGQQFRLSDVCDGAIFL